MILLRVKKYIVKINWKILKKLLNLILLIQDIISILISISIIP